MIGMVTTRSAIIDSVQTKAPGTSCINKMAVFLLSDPGTFGARGPNLFFFMSQHDKSQIFLNFDFKEGRKKRVPSLRNINAMI